VNDDWRGWLVRQPIAHRGLHGSTRGVVENSLAAAERAIAGGYAIECDVQASADGEAVVFHDDTLDRLTPAYGPLRRREAAALAALPLRGGSGRVPLLATLLQCVGGRAPLIVEIKSDFSGKMALADRVAALVAAYPGPVAIKSFDPAMIAHLRGRRVEFSIEHVPLGMVAQARYEAPDWASLDDALRQELAHFLHWPETRPDFLSYHVDDLPNAVPLLLREALGAPVLAWTVRTPEQRARAAYWADQIIFEDALA